MLPTHRPGPRTGRAVALAAAAAVALSPLAVASAASASTGHGQALDPATRFFSPMPDPGAVKQVASLTAHHDLKDAYLVGREATTPQAVWFTSGTPAQVRTAVHKTAVQAAATRTVPTMVVYDVPGRDCSQYSSGGAGSDQAYRAWADGFARGLLQDQQVIVVVEPDGLANLPSDCPGAYPGQDIGALTAGRIADITYAGQAIEKADPKALVYLDAGHSAWHSVADMTHRLEQAEVGKFQGFSLNVSNYQYTPNLRQYGTWISDCIALHPDASTTTPTDCGDEYYNGGPATNWAGGAMDPYQEWSDTASDPAANTSGVNSRYAGELAAAGATPTVHFVVDTSRNGRGPWNYKAAGYPDAGTAQDWCNPPGRGLGARPQADPAAAFPLLDAYLWVKTPGQSDGQCDRNGGNSPGAADPEWGNTVDPVAGQWFPQQALQLAKLASPPLR